MSVKIIVPWSTLMAKAKEFGKETDPKKKAILGQELKDLEALACSPNASIQIPTLNVSEVK